MKEAENRVPVAPSESVLTTRREFFRGCARFVLLGAGAFGGAVLLKRGQIKSAGQTCRNVGICSSCQTYRGCGLPPALSRRRALGEQERT